LVLILPVVAAVVLVCDALLSWRAEAASLALYEERTALLESKASTARVSPPANEVLDPGEGKILLDAQTSGLVSAEFQRLLSDRVGRVGAVIRRVDVPEDGQLASAGDPPLVSLERIRLTADIEVMEQSLPDLLHAIEAGAPVMIIDNFRLRLNRRVDMLGGELTTSSMDRPLSLNVTLSAFREKGPQS
jgi:hypothetical protein